MLSLAIWPKKISGSGGIPGPLVILGAASTAAASATTLQWGGGGIALDSPLIYYNLDGTVSSAPTWINTADPMNPILDAGLYSISASASPSSLLTTASSVILTTTVSRERNASPSVVFPVTDNLTSQTYYVQGIFVIRNTGTGHGSISVNLTAGNSAGNLGAISWSCAINVIKLG